jgi:hypothetical protein
MNDKKIVYWKSKITGIKGCGNPLPTDLADAWVIYGNKKYPNILHKATAPIINV